MQRGVPALGLTGLDGGLIRGRRNTGIRSREDGKFSGRRDLSGKPREVNSSASPAAGSRLSARADRSHRRRGRSRHQYGKRRRGGAAPGDPPSPDRHLAYGGGRTAGRSGRPRFSSPAPGPSRSRSGKKGRRGGSSGNSTASPSSFGPLPPGLSSPTGGGSIPSGPRWTEGGR